MKNKFYQNLTELKLKQPKKLELALIDGIKDGIKLTKTAIDMAMDVNDELENIVRMMNASKAAASLAEKEFSVLAKIEKSSKDLGIDVNTIKGYKQAAHNFSYVKKIQKIIDKNISKVKSAKL